MRLRMRGGERLRCDDNNNMQQLKKQYKYVTLGCTTRICHDVKYRV